MKNRRREPEPKRPNGFVLVGSHKIDYVISATYAAQTLKDYWPEANVTLFTEDRFIEPHLYDTFDQVIGGAPNSKRAKLWALPQTPYELTVYLDADVEIMHEDIRLIFDQMTDADILITRIRGYNGKISKFPGGELTDHCGLFMYRRTALNFMQQWWELWQKQKSGEWKWDTNLYPEQLRNWDQWSYWWLQNKTEHAIKRDYFSDDARWNFVNGYKYSETDKPIVIYHHTVKEKT